MLKRGLIIAVLVLVVGGVAALFIRDATTPPTPTALPLTKSFDQSPTGFTVRYPDDWEYVIPSIGLMILGPSETLFDNVPGPTFTIQRAEPLSVVGSLDSALDRYLQNGPLRISGQWQITQPVSSLQFQDREARVVEVAGSNAGQTRLHSQILVTHSANTFVYFFTATVPIDKQAAYAPTFAAMLASIKLLE